MFGVLGQELVDVCAGFGIVVEGGIVDADAEFVGVLVRDRLAFRGDGSVGLGAVDAAGFALLICTH